MPGMRSTTASRHPQTSDDLASPVTETIITSGVRLISEVLRSGRFQVPWYQRYYDWNEEQVRELLYDLKDALDTSKTCYFLGSIMLVTPANTKPRRINDGQQRLITLSLLTAAFCRHFAQKRPFDTSRETIALRALFDRPANETSRLADASRYEPRIQAPKIDNSRYTQILRGRDIGTNGLLTAAWNIIDIFVGGMSKSAREDFFDFLMNKVEVSVLDVPTSVDSNSVFEVLNARGKSLDEVDLIRNRLYSYFSEPDDAARRETVHEHLERIGIILRTKSTVEEYYRCFLQCRYGYLQKTRFYRDLRREIGNAADRRNPSDHVFDLVTSLGRKDSIELFRVIKSSRAIKSLERLLPTIAGKRKLPVLLGDLKGYTVSHPIVFALLYRFMCETDGDEKRRVGRIAVRSLKNLTSFVMRTAFVTPKFEPYKFDAAFANTAQTLLASTDIASLDILEELRRNDELNVFNDDSFIRRMAEIEIRDKKKAFRYLFAINANAQPGSDILRETQCATEHILPLSKEHWEDWTGFKDVDPEDWVYRTGNLVVLSKRENRPGANFNRNFAAKKGAFKDSPVLMARTVEERHNEWTPKVIEKRSLQLARDAASIWKFENRKGV